MNNMSKNELEGQKIASTLMATASIHGDDKLDTELLIKMAEYSEKYLSSFSWCQAVLESYFAGGVGGIFAVFFFRIKPSRSNIDPWFWIMGGNVPPAYLPLRNCKSASQAFRMYVIGMHKWVEYARKGQTGADDRDVPPVNLPPTPEVAEEINKKIEGLVLAVGPFFPVGSEGDQWRR
jgi:hypothetical protein